MDVLLFFFLIFIHVKSTKRESKIILFIQLSSSHILLLQYMNLFLVISHWWDFNRILSYYILWTHLSKLSGNLSLICATLSYFHEITQICKAYKTTMVNNSSLSFSLRVVIESSLAKSIQHYNFESAWYSISVMLLTVLSCFFIPPPFIRGSPTASLTLLLSIESVLVAITSSIPEEGALLSGCIVVPF